MPVLKSVIPIGIIAGIAVGIALMFAGVITR